MLTALLNVHAVSTLLMTGLVWTIQLVHYPLFARVGHAAFCDYEAEHTRRITWLVGPLMMVEGLTAFALVAALEAANARAMAGVGVLLVLVIWASTAFLQVPCHTRLGGGFEQAALTRLVATNWIRTVAWSVRGVLAIVLLRFAPP